MSQKNQCSSTPVVPKGEFFKPPNTPSNPPFPYWLLQQETEKLERELTERKECLRLDRKERSHVKRFHSSG